jgi:hypothetical protein
VRDGLEQFDKQSLVVARHCDLPRHVEAEHEDCVFGNGEYLGFGESQILLLMHMNQTAIQMCPHVIACVRLIVRRSRFVKKPNNRALRLLSRSETYFTHQNSSKTLNKLT